MGFSWVEDVAIGWSIDSDDMIEMRTNVDWLDDNKCNTADTSDEYAYDSDQKSSEYGTNYSTQDNGYDSTDIGTDNGAECPSDLDAAKAGNQGSNYTANNIDKSSAFDPNQQCGMFHSSDVE